MEKINQLECPQVTLQYKDSNCNKRVTIKSSDICYDILKPLYNDCMQHHEECWIIYLNHANKVLGALCASKCGINCTIIDKKIILQAALLCHATAIIMSHNHPSGNLIPSEIDKTQTKKLKKACETLDIALLDHIIITEDGYVSFADEGIL
jgi:DNA repair proteins